LFFIQGPVLLKYNICDEAFSSRRRGGMRLPTDQLQPWLVGQEQLGLGLGRGDGGLSRQPGRRSVRGRGGGRGGGGRG